MPQLVDSGMFSVTASDGSLGVGWQIYTYASGTSTPLASYPTLTDANALTNAHSQPIVIGSSGRPPQIWINAACKVVLMDDQSVVKETLDPVTDTGGSSSSVTFATGPEVMAGTSSTKALSPYNLALATVPASLTDGASIPWDMATKVNATVTIAASRTLATPTNPIQGRTYVLEVKQGGSGSYTMTWPASFDWGTAGAPTLSKTAGKTDIITIYCRDAVTPKFFAVMSGKGLA